MASIVTIVFSPLSVSAGTDSSKLHVLHYFSGGATDGGLPPGPVAVGTNGVLYGSTGFGGSADFGVTFELTPPAVAGRNGRKH